MVTGAAGQIGSELVPALRKVYGEDSVLATDICAPEGLIAQSGLFEILDATDEQSVGNTAMRYKADTIYHLAAILSAAGEGDPHLAYKVNMGSLYSVLEVARQQGCAVFTPSSVAVFGASTPKDPTPQDTVMRPSTMYGVTKVAGELLSDYYYLKYGVDTRGVRYPGLISHGAPPGGGTTDWAVDIFFQAVEHGCYTCFLEADTRLDMMYMPDAIRAAIEIMEVDRSRLRHRNAYNVSAMQVDPATLATEIRKHLPDFEISYAVDPIREAIAQSWPRRVDDTVARMEWGWTPEYDIVGMTADMIEEVSGRMSL